MKLSEIVYNDKWSPEIKEEFYNKIRRSPNDYTKSQNCCSKAEFISSKYPDDALEILDFGIKNFYHDKVGLISLYSSKANILETEKQDYLGAYTIYVKLSKLNGGFGGYPLERVRLLLRINKLNVDEKIINIYHKNLKYIDDLPTRDFRFWIAVITSEMFKYSGDNEKSKNILKWLFQFIMNKVKVYLIKYQEI